MANSNNEFYQNSLINVRKDNDEWKNAAGTCSANMIEKTITENGQYTAKEDGADGYSMVNVSTPSAEYQSFEVKSFTVNQNGYPSDPQSDLTHMNLMAILLPTSDVITLKCGYLDISQLKTPGPVVVCGKVKRLNVVTVSSIWLVVTIYIDEDFEGVYLDGVAATPLNGSIVPNAWNSLLFQQGQFKKAQTDSWIGVYEVDVLAD